MNEPENPVDFDGKREIPIDEYENSSKRLIPGYDGLYKLSQIMLAERLPEEAEILIVGAGGGKEIVTFGNAFPRARFTGVDPSEKMLAVAAQNVEKANLQDRVKLVRGTVDDLEEKQFDAATALLVMQFLPDDGAKLRFLQSIHRRLKQGARLVFADGCFDKNKPAELAWLMNAYQNHAQINGVPAEKAENMGKEIIERVNAVSVEREIELFLESGFGDIRQFFQGLWLRAWALVKL